MTNTTSLSAKIFCLNLNIKKCKSVKWFVAFKEKIIIIMGLIDDLMMEVLRLR